MSEVVNYDQLVAFLHEASLHEIYRVSAALDKALEDPARIAAVYKQFKAGDTVEYYNAETNVLTQARVIKKKIKYVLVVNCNDGKRWNIPYCWLKINSRDIVFEETNTGLNKNTLRVGDWGGFHYNGEEITGCVKRLNRKTVTIITATQRQWRVAYQYLYTVINGEQYTPVIEHVQINTPDK